MHTGNDLCPRSEEPPLTETSRAYRIAIGIATRGRPLILIDTIADLMNQARQPDAIVVSYSELSDIGNAYERFPEVAFVQGEAGLTKQRNRILKEVKNMDLVIFIDDDFYLHAFYIMLVEQMFISNTKIVIATGRLLADGINGPGLKFGEAKTYIKNARITPNIACSHVFNAYGCNMCLRVKPIINANLQFDENLPLYGWYEDVDFCRQLARHGEVVRVENAVGVHLGAKSGRQSGVRLGYSQVANPFYLAKKCSIPWRFAIASMVSRSIKNLVRSVKPEPFVDRRGRLRGNLLGWFELLQGKNTPQRIISIVS